MRSGQHGKLDGRAVPHGPRDDRFSVRNGNLRENGDALCQGKLALMKISSRRNFGHNLHRKVATGNESWGPYSRVCRRLADARGLRFSQYVLDADDPFSEGFTIGDIWMSVCDQIVPRGTISLSPFKIIHLDIFPAVFR